MLTQSTTPYDDQEGDNQTDKTKEDDSYWDDTPESENVNNI